MQKLTPAIVQAAMARGVAKAVAAMLDKLAERNAARRKEA